MTKILMSYFKLQVSFSLNFASLFSVMRDILLYFFSLNFILLWQMELSKWQISHFRFHKICTLLGSFCWKYIKFQLKSKEELCLMTLKNDPKIEENEFVVSKMTRIWWVLIWALRSLKYFHFDWSLLYKVYNVSLKNVQMSYLSWHWRVMQNFKKYWLVVWKWYNELGTFLPEWLKVSKLVLALDPFDRSWKFMRLNFQESYVSWQWGMMQKLKRNWLVT